MSQVLITAPKDIQKGVKTVAKKTDTSKVKILELIALTGELSADEIKSFSGSPSYAEKLITTLKKESYIKKYKNSEKSTLRLTSKGRDYLKEVLPEIFDSLLNGQKTMNRVRDDKRRTERRNKLVDILLMLYRADVKILPDEKTLLYNTSAPTRTDAADNTDDCRPEFYTSAEIKSLIPDYKNGIGSRALGILIAYERLYIIYSTVDGDLFWRHDTEKNFYTDTVSVLSDKLFGKNKCTYMLVLAQKSTAAAAIMKRYKGTHQGKIYPTCDLPNMIFAVNDTEDATLDIVLHNDNVIYRLENAFRKEIVPDKKYPFMDGVRREYIKEQSGAVKERETYYLCAFRFDLDKVAKSIDVSVEKKMKVNIICFDYQRKYIEAFLKTLNGKTHRVDVLSDSIESYKENYLL